MLMWKKILLAILAQLPVLKDEDSQVEFGENVGKAVEDGFVDEGPIRGAVEAVILGLPEDAEISGGIAQALLALFKEQTAARPSMSRKSTGRTFNEHHVQSMIASVLTSFMNDATMDLGDSDTSKVQRAREKWDSHKIQLFIRNH